MSVKLTVNKMTSSLKRIQRRLDNLPREAYQVFKDNTPVKTGYAKSQTKLQGDTIVANYPYAEVLDKGRHRTNRGMRGSTQAPVGMSKPTEQFIKQRIPQILAGK